MWSIWPRSLKARTSPFQGKSAGFKSRRGHYGDCSSSGRAVDCGSIGCEFESRRAPYGYTYISFDYAEEELKRMEEFRKAQAEIEKKNDAKAV